MCLRAPLRSKIVLENICLCTDVQLLDCGIIWIIETDEMLCKIYKFCGFATSTEESSQKQNDESNRWTFQGKRLGWDFFSLWKKLMPSFGSLIFLGQVFQSSLTNQCFHSTLNFHKWSRSRSLSPESPFSALHFGICPSKLCSCWKSKTLYLFGGKNALLERSSR